MKNKKPKRQTDGANSVAIADLFGEWMPIETAPCDGTEILAYDSRNEAYDVVRWEESGSPADTSAFIAPNGYPGFDYSHWMPLPFPPNVEDTRRMGASPFC